MYMFECCSQIGGVVKLTAIIKLTCLFFKNDFAMKVNFVTCVGLDVKNFSSTPTRLFQVSTVLNGMLDQSFRDRASQKHQGLNLVTVILQNWKKCDLWWASDSAPESKVAVLTLLAKLLQVI